MRIFYNPETRQQIIVMDDFACSIYLQSDETPAAKADEVLNAYRADKANVSTCPEIDLTVDMPKLPVEDGPKPDHSNDVTNSDNGDYKAN